MTKFSSRIGLKSIARIAAITGLGFAVSGCVYDAGLGLGYASDGYNSGYGCDAYSDFDNYYDCDYGAGFNNIGYGGGWYSNYYYPGYGYFVFDNYGRRYQMHRDHQRYWGGQRFNWYRQNGRGHHNGGGRHDGGHQYAVITAMAAITATVVFTAILAAAGTTVTTSLLAAFRLEEWGTFPTIRADQISPQFKAINPARST
jgi:hypothetical protein